MQSNNQNQTQDDHDHDDQLLEEVTENLGKTLTLEEEQQEEDYDEIDDDDEDEDEDEVDDEEFEFSFGGEEVKSPVSADEVFHNGKIRSTVPFYSGEAAVEEPPPVKKVFVVSSTAENDNVVEGPYCVWATENLSSNNSNINQVISPEMSKKSNSTGFSRLRKMKDLLVRSNSDGKDTFVFLNGKASEKKVKKDKKKKSVDDVGVEALEKSVNKKKGKASMTAAYEALYGKKDKKSGGGSGGGGEKSYLPYRVGFFTNASGLSKNVHPY